MNPRRDLASSNPSVSLLYWGNADRYTKHCPMVLRMVVPGKGSVMELWANQSQPGDEEHPGRQHPFPKHRLRWTIEQSCSSVQENRERGRISHRVERGPAQESCNRTGSQDSWKL